jgi:hypothetical protein
VNFLSALGWDSSTERCWRRFMARGMGGLPIKLWGLVGLLLRFGDRGCWGICGWGWGSEGVAERDVNYCLEL